MHTISQERFFLRWMVLLALAGYWSTSHGSALCVGTWSGPNGRVSSLQNALCLFALYWDPMSWHRSQLEFDVDDCIYTYSWEVTRCVTIHHFGHFSICQYDVLDFVSGFQSYWLSLACLTFYSPSATFEFNNPFLQCAVDKALPSASYCCPIGVPYVICPWDQGREWLHKVWCWSFSKKVLTCNYPNRNTTEVINFSISA